jgi:hypothetical protein
MGSNWYVANKVKGIIADADERWLEDCCRWNRECNDGRILKAAADGTGIVPMEQELCR